MTPQPRHLFVSDLDGTLLGTDSRISTESAKIISTLSARHGALITVATARTPATVEPLLAGIHLNIPAIVMTGAAEWSLTEHHFNSVIYLDSSTADAIDALCRACGVTPFRYTVAPDGMIHAFHNGGKLTACEQKFLDERTHLQYKRMHIDESLPPTLAAQCTVMFFAIGPAGKVLPAAELLKQRGDCRVSSYHDIYSRDNALLEVFAPEVSKAAAVQNLAQRIGAKHITVFGDNLNDLSMMAVADTAVAVANADPKVKEAAHVIIGPNSADSVARYILEQCTKHL